MKIANKSTHKHIELVPTDGRKSFYGKCFVVGTDDGEVQTLYSYGLPVVSRINGHLVRHDINSTATTMRHIRAFASMTVQNKKDFMSLDYVNPCEAKYV